MAVMLSQGLLEVRLRASITGGLRLDTDSLALNFSRYNIDIDQISHILQSAMVVECEPQSPFCIWQTVNGRFVTVCH